MEERILEQMEEIRLQLHTITELLMIIAGHCEGAQAEKEEE